MPDFPTITSMGEYTSGVFYDKTTGPDHNRPGPNTWFTASALHITYRTPARFAPTAWQNGTLDDPSDVEQTNAASDTAANFRYGFVADTHDGRYFYAAQAVLCFDLNGLFSKYPDALITSASITFRGGPLIGGNSASFIAVSSSAGTKGSIWDGADMHKDALPTGLSGTTESQNNWNKLE